MDRRAPPRGRPRETRRKMRVPADLSDRLIAEGRADDRSATYVLERILREHFARKDAETTGDTQR